MSLETAEAPLSHPEQDLLGFAAHATQLVDVLDTADLPLTVGIYGPWGAGKTSFANLVEFELRKRPQWQNARFINFSAWPYLTPDAIWQALVERIAREICKQGRKEKSELEDGVDASWSSRLRRALLSDALTLRAADSDPGKEKYERLVQRLNIAAGIASRTASDRVSGLTVGRAAAIFLDSATSLAPAVAPIRKLISGDGTTKGLVPTEQVAPVLVQTVEDIRSDLQDLFEYAGDAHLIILIDDLDRCLPEVALDVLETIKIFFFESAARKSRCLFLVAADERLLARGLRARLGEDESVLDHAGEARAYLEKLVQFGIALPEVEGVDSRKLVVTWAPEWACAADLITHALDNNPRRIKQQSTVLSYYFKARRMIPRAVQESVRNVAGPALAKLVRLNAVSARSVKQLSTLLGRSDLQQGLVNHEDMDLENGEADPKTRLASTLRTCPEALKTLKRLPLLSQQPEKTLQALLLLADITVDVNGLPVSRDTPFRYVYRAVVAQRGTTTARRLDVSYVRRLLELKRYIPTLADAIHSERVTGDSRYRSAILGLDKWLVEMSTGLASEPSPTARRLADTCRPFLSDASLYQLLLARPLISEIPLEYVEPVLTWSGSAPVPGEAAEITPSATDELTISALAAAQEVVPDDGFPSVELRLDLARDMFERRKFSKVRLLLSRWPMLADLARGPSGLRRLKDLESVLLKRDPDASLPTSWADLQDDEALREFLKVPPSFADIHDGELEKLAPTTIDSSPTPSSHVATEDVPPVRQYTNIRLRASCSPDQPDRGDGCIELDIAVEYGERKAQQVISVPMLDIRRLMAFLVIRYPNIERTSMIQMASSSHISAREALTDIGSILWTSIFGANPGLSTILLDALSAADRVRLVVEAGDVVAAEIPWECIYLSSHRVFVGQTLKLSVVRGVPDPVNLVPVRVGSPLRMLVVASDLAGLPLLGVEQEVELIGRNLSVRADAVRIDVLRSPTRQSLLMALQSYSPHIVHYMGHGTIIEGKGAVVLSGDDGQPDALLADDLGLMLQDYGIMLAVLNGCVTGSSEVSGVGQSVAQALVRQGVPAAIATSRNVYDDAALRFASDFYTAFVNGQPAEASLVEARKALGLAGFDWSAYVMYGSMLFPIHDIRVPGRVPMPFA